MAVTSTYLASLLLVVTLANAFIRLGDQFVGMEIVPPDLHPRFTPLGSYSPYYQQLIEGIGRSRIVEDTDAFRIYLDVQPFKPDEMQVKVIDNHVQVEGKHEEKTNEHGLNATLLVRRYWLPEGVELQALVYEISPEGVLTITVPKKELPEAQNGITALTAPTTVPLLQQTKEENNTTKEEISETEESEDYETY